MRKRHPLSIVAPALAGTAAFPVIAIYAGCQVITARARYIKFSA